MRNFILSWKTVLVCSIILGVVVGIQYLANHAILDETQKWATTCTFVEWDARGNTYVEMKLQCEDGEEGVISNSPVIVSYLKDPGPLTCKRYETESVRCEMRGQAEEKP